MMTSELKTDTVYLVTKKSSDGTFHAGDVFYIDSKDGALVDVIAHGWLDKEELTPEVMSFECRPMPEYRVQRTAHGTGIVRVEDLVNLINRSTTPT